MMHALGIVWNPSEGIDLGFYEVHYYSLMFATAFGLGWYLTKKIFERENEPVEKLDSLFIWTSVATMLGARLGHVFFYDWPYYKNHLLEIILPIRETANGWKFTGFTGLASHGATIAIIVFMYFFSKKVMKRPLLWILDRITIPVASGAVFVRLGNFINSEIFGHATSKDAFYAIQFIEGDTYWETHNVQQITQASTAHKGYLLIETDPRFIEVLNQIPFRHPTQLYEAFGYIFVFLIVFYAYWKTEARQKQGLLLGLFLILLFTVRFIVEFVKESQGGFEGDNPILSTGQWLSIPFILTGLFLVFKARKQVII
jgi:prolipoprotein diacylglyceryl transferase